MGFNSKSHTLKHKPYCLCQLQGWSLCSEKDNISDPQPQILPRRVYLALCHLLAKEALPGLGDWKTGSALSCCLLSLEMLGREKEKFIMKHRPQN